MASNWLPTGFKRWGRDDIGAPERRPRFFGHRTWPAAPQPQQTTRDRFLSSPARRMLSICNLQSTILKFQFPLAMKRRPSVPAVLGLLTLALTAAGQQWTATTSLPDGYNEHSLGYWAGFLYQAGGASTLHGSAAGADVRFVSEPNGCLPFTPPCGLAPGALVKKSGVIPYNVFVP